jgi:hypothetical protein
MPFLMYYTDPKLTPWTQVFAVCYMLDHWSFRTSWIFPCAKVCNFCPLPTKAHSYTVAIKRHNNLQTEMCPTRAWIHRISVDTGLSLKLLCVLTAISTQSLLYGLCSTIDPSGPLGRTSGLKIGTGYRVDKCSTRVHPFDLAIGGIAVIDVVRFGTW